MAELGRKFDQQKTRWDLLPWRLLRVLANLRTGRLREPPARPTGLATPDRSDLVPDDAVEAVGVVLGYGAEKYVEWNWEHVRGWRWRYFGATIRHLVAWWLGERLDTESGLPHLAHALTCLMFLFSLDERRYTGRLPRRSPNAAPPPSSPG